MILRLISALVFAAALAARGGGPFAADAGGLSASSTVFRAWISRVVSTNRPDGSGGFAHDDAGYSTDSTTAVAGRPVDFDIVGYQDPTTHVLSLGDGGSVTVSFDEPIGDGAGPDFAVFENGFFDGTPRSGDTNRYLFAELAYVEVATATNAWARFPCQSLVSNDLFNYSVEGLGRYASLDVTFIDGLAGKNSIDFGAPFDLAALRSDPNVLNGSVDLSNILYVRVVDVVGDGSRLDSSNRPIRDPFYNVFAPGLVAPASTSTDGFDLRAIGVINSGRVLCQGPGGLRWFGVSGQCYRVQHAALPGGPWNDVGTVQTGATSWVSYTNTAPGFYRLNRWAAP